MAAAWDAAESAASLRTPLRYKCDEDFCGTSSAPISPNATRMQDKRTPSPPPAEMRKCSSLSWQDTREGVRNLPDLTVQINTLGLTQEYAAFKDRYMAWRQGEAKGSRGEVTFQDLQKDGNAAANLGWRFYYPTDEEWQWKRTMTYWIAVTFFEGAIFFTVSSFMFNQKEWLGDRFKPMTLGGYIAGKVLFLICCYLMCLETINFTRITHGTKVQVGMDDAFYYWPYRWKVARERLEAGGASFLSYVISVVYFTGVLSFAVGLVMILWTSLPGSVRHPVKNATFLVGAALFCGGGFCECIANRSAPVWSLGFLSAVGNFIGGSLFLAGAVFNYFDAYTSNNCFGLGSFVYMVASSMTIFMWNDEQFGLSFVAVLNRAPKRGPDQQPRNMSLRGAIFVHLCCFCGAAATYNFNIELALYLQAESFRLFQRALNEFLPVFLAHGMMILTSAVVRVPKAAPLRQVYLLLRYLCALLLVNSLYTLYEFLFRYIQD